MRHTITWGWTKRFENLTFFIMEVLLSAQDRPSARQVVVVAAVIYYLKVILISLLCRERNSC